MVVFETGGCFMVRSAGWQQRKFENFSHRETRVMFRRGCQFPRECLRSSHMSDSPVELDLKFLPAWLKEAPAPNRYADFAGEEPRRERDDWRGPGRGPSRGPRPPQGDRDRGPRRDDRGGGRPSGPGGRQGKPGGFGGLAGSMTTVDIAISVRRSRRRRAFRW